MFNRALAFWEASRSTTTTSSDRDREMLQNSVRVVTLLGKAKMIPSILASTCEIYQFVSPYELFLLLNAIWGFLHCNPVTQAGIQKKLPDRWRSRVSLSFWKPYQGLIDSNFEKCNVDLYLTDARNILLKNIDKTAHVYHKFCSWGTVIELQSSISSILSKSCRNKKPGNIPIPRLVILHGAK